MIIIVIVIVVVVGDDTYYWVYLSSDHTVLQSAASVITKCDNFITNWDTYYKVQQKKRYPCSVALCNNRRFVIKLSHFAIPVAFCNEKAVVLCNKLEMDIRRTSKPNNKYHHRQKQQQQQ